MKTEQHASRNEQDLHSRLLSAAAHWHGMGWKHLDSLLREAAKALEWSEDDQPLPEDAAIKDAHPLRTKDHDTYHEAMRLVGAKRSKYALVDLVNWLLTLRAPASETATPSRDEQERAMLLARKTWHRNLGADGVSPCPTNRECRAFEAGFRAALLHVEASAPSETRARGGIPSIMDKIADEVLASDVAEKAAAMSRATAPAAPAREAVLEELEDLLKAKSRSLRHEGGFGNQRVYGVEDAISILRALKAKP